MKLSAVVFLYKERPCIHNKGLGRQTNQLFAKDGWQLDLDETGWVHVLHKDYAGDTRAYSPAAVRYVEYAVEAPATKGKGR